MRYHYEKPEIYVSNYGETYICDHPVYDRCTLFRIGDKGLAVIQQRFNPETKETRWTEIDPWLTDAIYSNSNFKTSFEKYGTKPVNMETCCAMQELIKKSFSADMTVTSTNYLYPTLTVRQVMWALKMKPLRGERWKIAFDRKNI